MAERDNKQLKFIEILLIVGGIIGGLGVKSGDSSIRFILTFFLISSLMYYYAVSNQLYGKVRKGFAMSTSSFFAVLITYPLMSSTPALISFWGSNYPKFNIINNSILAIILSILIFINLQEESEIVFGKILNSQNLIIIIIGAFFTLLLLNFGSF